MLRTKITRWVSQGIDALRILKNAREHLDRQLILAAEPAIREIRNTSALAVLADAELKVFSQWGDDGIVQWLVSHIDLPNTRFVEFGVQDYWESTTRYLLMHDNWSGLVLDSCATHVKSIRSSYYYARYDLTAAAAFLTQENIENTLQENNFGDDIGLLHIDIDGMDYWAWNAIEHSRPFIVILEYNSLFGAQRSITVPYDAHFDRTAAHYSNLYFGASLQALKDLAEARAYRFVGCNSAGNNAYFVRQDIWKPELFTSRDMPKFTVSKFRESRDRDHNLTYRSGQQRIDLIAGMPVFNTKTGQLEPL